MDDKENRKIHIDETTSLPLTIKSKGSVYEDDYKIFFKNFEKNNEKINFYYYDGEHSYKNQYDNLEIVENFLSRGSIIMIDDINFVEVETATKDFINKNISKYEIIKEIKTANNNCHPSFWNGIIIIKRK